MRDERGMTLVELLVAMTVSLAVLGTAVGLLSPFVRSEARATEAHEASDAARTATERLARELRNLASPTPALPLAVEVALPYDLVFQTVDPVGPNSGQNATNVRRVRYCLDRAGSDRAARLWTQSQTWTLPAPPALPSVAACPSPAWGSSRIAVERVVNRRDGRDRPLFRYDSAVPADVHRIRTELWVDPDPLDGAPETALRTGVILRNQNRRPTASFGLTITANAHALLNGSTSEDPEGRALTYVWYDGQTKLTTCEGNVVCDVPLGPSGTVHQLRLRVYDPAGLEGVSDVQAVTAP